MINALDKDFKITKTQSEVVQNNVNLQTISIEKKIDENVKNINEKKQNNQKKQQNNNKNTIKEGNQQQNSSQNNVQGQEGDKKFHTQKREKKKLTPEEFAKQKELKRVQQEERDAKAKEQKELKDTQPSNPTQTIQEKIVEKNPEDKNISQVDGKKNKNIIEEKAEESYEEKLKKTEMELNNLLQKNYISTGTKIGINYSIARCVIGSNVTIGQNVKMINCVILNDAKIEDNSNIKNCFIGEKCVIGNKTTLDDVIVVNEAIVQSETRTNRQVIYKKTENSIVDTSIFIAQETENI